MITTQQLYLHSELGWKTDPEKLGWYLALNGGDLEVKPRTEFKYNTFLGFQNLFLGQ
jgi:hypothetical protein